MNPYVSNFKNWKHETDYERGDYIYPSNRKGMYFKCLVAGQSQSYDWGISGRTEPSWLVNTDIKEGVLIWKFVPYVLGTPVWQPSTTYNLNDNVTPTYGPIYYNSNPYMFTLDRIIAEPDWPSRPKQRIYDGTCVWESKVSFQNFIPRKLQKAPIYVEVYENLDYINEWKSPDYDSAIYKFHDWKKVSLDSLYSFMQENGYEYIIDILDLEREELEVITGYANLIHFLKGTKQGLELVFNILKIAYQMKEWWELDPIGEPDTWNLIIDLNLSNVKRDTISKFVTFARNYVYPTLAEFLILYTVELAEVTITNAGFFDKEWLSEIGPFVFMYIVHAGFFDFEYDCIWGDVDTKYLITQGGDNVVTQSGDKLLIQSSI